MAKWQEPIHPGEILSDELEFIGVSASVLAIRIKVPKNRIYQIIRKKRAITADTAIRLGIFFGTSPDFWLNLQKSYELDIAKKEISKTAYQIKPYKEQPMAWA